MRVVVDTGVFSAALSRRRRERFESHIAHPELTDDQRSRIYLAALGYIRTGFPGFSPETSIVAAYLVPRSCIVFTQGGGAAFRSRSGVAGVSNLGTYGGHGIASYDLTAPAGGLITVHA